MKIAGVVIDDDDALRDLPLSNYICIHIYD
jgi:hypothetical protein